MVEAAYVGGSALIARNYGSSDAAVEATALQSYGVRGETSSALYCGVAGHNSAGGDGVRGLASGSAPSGPSSGVAGENVGGGFGVYGHTDSTSAYGVYGKNDSGTGVGGYTASLNGSAIYGQHDGGGAGVAGVSNGPGGTGVQGTAIGVGGVALMGYGGDGGTALKVDGRAEFSRSGRKRIPGGAIKAVVAVAGATTSSLVLATLQKHVTGYSLAGAVPETDSVTVWLNQPAPTGGLPVAWFVLD